MKRKFLLLLVTLLSCCMASAQEVKKIAILETVDKEENVKYGVELLVRTQMTKAIIEIEGYEAYDRISMSQVMGEHNFQRTGYVSDEQIKEIGIAAGADYVLIMEAAYVDDATILLSSKFINIETTEIELIDMEQTATDAQSVLTACRTLAKRMLQPGASQGESSSKSGSTGYSPKSQPQQGSACEIEVNGVTFKMIKVEGGLFSMGATAEQTSYANDEKPVHQVTLSDYYIAETEVTQELWCAVMGNNPSYFTGSSRNPVEQVSWYDCQRFIQKLNQLTGLRFRLPTEAEWEYAARGGNQSKGYKYSGSNRIDDIAWYAGNSSSVTHEVAKCYPNELGIYDMSGNVWEWCSDWYGSYSGGAAFDPEGPSSGSFRVLRGGGWSYAASRCRVANRGNGTPENRFSNDGGFRLACSRL